MYSESVKIQTVLVPAGAEYQAVKSGLSRVPNAPELVAIPAGPQGVKTFLETRSIREGGVLLMGLGGSLTPELSVGNGVVIEKIWQAAGEMFACDRTLTTQLAERLRIATGIGVTCDRVITTVAEKKRLGDRYSASVVDMEGAVLLKALPERAIAILRVISDDCQDDLPDIAGAIAADGSLRPMYLALSFIKRPLSAIRFIRGSLKGLKALENVAFALF
ncbi:phosphorylase [Leptolyngbya sp. BC1307]|uniref:phosphorylase family protein n=1 Tax=Leptolyngbya sp. BC1307 TaxID=2029589 RepID=UPI000EFBD16D|nr:phosphorylase [Leptolyngbya sp. BC1307]